MRRRFQSILLLAQLLAGSVHGILPLRDQWHAACADLAASRATDALGRFHEFDRWYGNEPDVRDSAFREGWIRLWGLAALQAGALAEATSLLERWFAENPDQPRYRAFLRFQLVGLYRNGGDETKAREQGQIFLEEHPELPECALIRWNRADAAIAAGDYLSARTELELVRSIEGLPPSGRALAAAGLAMVELATGAHEAALALLRETTGPCDTRLLRFWRAFSAPALVQELLGAGLAGPAMEAARWFDAPDSLLHDLAEFNSGFQERSALHNRSGIRQGIWNTHWQAQLARLEWALKQQAGAGGSLELLYQLRLRALLEAASHGRTLILGQAILDSPQQTGPGLRVESYKAIIEASLGLKNWTRAEACAREFREAHPDDPALPDILFLNARTAAGREDWPAAIEQVETLLQSFPDHASRRSWAMLHADWLLQSGAPAAALDCYTKLAAEAPAPWQPFLLFQQGRCQEALRNWDPAADCFRTTAGNSAATANLREFAQTSLLKLHLRRMNGPAFEDALDTYQRTWPDGMNRLMVANLHGTHLQRSGQAAPAIAVFLAVSRESGPAALFAREQLSALYRLVQDMESLRTHAIAWIRDAVDGKAGISETPFADLRLYQQTQHTAAIPEGLFTSLMETVEGGNPVLPVTPCMEVIRERWTNYREWIGGKPSTIMDHASAVADAAHRAANWPAYAAFQLYAAHLLDREARRDSADTRRIQVLQAVGGGRLGEEPDFVLAKTAHEYDFPEAQPLLETFIAHYPESSRQPDARVFLAGRLRLKGDLAQARALVGGVIRDWPDAAVYQPAALLLSRWSLEDAEPETALQILGRLLEQPGLPASTTAEALLLRARADFDSGAIQRGLLDCLRILALYPDIHDISDSAVVLLSDQYKRLPEGTERDQLRTKIEQTLSRDVLEKLPFTEA